MCMSKELILQTKIAEVKIMSKEVMSQKIIIPCITPVN